MRIILHSILTASCHVGIQASLDGFSKFSESEWGGVIDNVEYMFRTCKGIDVDIM